MNEDRTQAIAHAREVDTRIAAAWNTYYQHRATLTTLTKRLTRAEETANRGTRVYGLDELRTRVNNARTLTQEAQTTAHNLDTTEYQGWTRFFLVKHIHATTHCSSFRPTTQIGWLPNLSGLTEAEAVKEHGAILCTLCYPTAPVEWTRGNQPTNDDRCPGSGTPIDSTLPNRRGYYSGNWATCPTCTKHVGITNRSHAIPKHTPAT